MGTESTQAPAESAVHVVLLASPGAGHILPVAELARRVVARGAGVTATLVTYTNFSSADHSSTLASLPPSVSTAVLPEVPLDDLPAEARIETRIFTVVKRALPQLRDLLLSLLEPPGPGVAAFIPDLLCPWAFEVSMELSVPGYLFCTTNLMALSCILHVPELDRTTTCEFRDLPEPVRLPGCVPLRGVELLDPIQDRSDPAYRLMVELGKNQLLADGFIVNTFDAMEHETLVAFKELSDKGLYPPAYAVGPFVRSSSGGEADKHSCLRWLDEQPDGSVLYVCFGSGGTLSNEQTAELAAGLEASGRRFLWVVRFPSDKDRSASFFGRSRGEANSPINYLPEGFVERTTATGLTVPEWAPQVEILNHRAVGGFLSHCGWNSTLEAVAAGVPTLAWPLYAEQRMNAVMLSERAGLALRPRADSCGEDEVVPREEVAAVVRELMAGKKGAAAREKARELRETAAKAWAQDGPSRRAFDAVAGKWKQAERAG
ncbi:hydroquinone glucosyltransferase-like [Phragmites australis]|uniref:hydroquinone glucosyltransferase-like n=1 Tax=Phragmites australis TaxID=29695 RepID=UPI002D765601|nr:hydroquinone glucosyltransferase-like [Phragmites australis]